MKKILMLSTGGTIASEPTTSGLAPQISGQTMLEMLPQLKDLCKIDCMEVLNLDSTNIQPGHWKILAEKIYYSLPDYDGIVITHGTDTMAYTAAALSLMLQNLDKPVILTGAQIPIIDPNSDGKKNILDAFYACTSNLRGIYVVFDGCIIHGCHASKCHTLDFHAFTSVNYPMIGSIENGEVSIQLTSEYAAKGDPILNTKLNTNIIPVTLIPGFAPELLETIVNSGVDGIIIAGFGLGGIPHAGKNLLPIIEKAVKKKIAVIITTQCPAGKCDLTVYDVGMKAGILGVISGDTMTFETLTVKLMWALGHSKDLDTVRGILHHNYVGEYGFE